MGISQFIFVTLFLTSNVGTVPLGLISNAALVSMPSNMTMNGSTCDECKCKMFTSNNNVIFLSFNCFTLDSAQVTCQFFTTAIYLSNYSYSIVENSNSTFFFQHLDPNPTLATTVGTMTTSSSDVSSAGTFCFTSMRCEAEAFVLIVAFSSISTRSSSSENSSRNLDDCSVDDDDHRTERCRGRSVQYDCRWFYRGQQRSLCYIC